MNKGRKYKITAIFLLTVFSLNTLAGFACSLGFDLGYNRIHHHDEQDTETIVQHHREGKNLVHHFHHEVNNHKSKGNKDDCCSDEVTNFARLDKAVPASLQIVHPAFLPAFFETFYNDALLSPGVVKNIKQFVRSYHPPIPDIRVAIQSFQV
jgi:hypothetical protein